MRHNIGLIAGASALVLAGVLSVQTGVFSRNEGSTSLPPTAGQAADTATATPAEMTAVIATPDPALTDLADQIAALRETVAAREADLVVMGETLAARDATIAEMTTALADRDAELERLRTDLASLQDRFAFDLKLASLKTGDVGPEGTDNGSAADVGASGTPSAPGAPEPRPITSINFNKNSADLTPGGQVHAAAAAVMMSDMKLVQIRIIGFTDRTGSPARNRVLAERRARAVADFLVAQGVPPTMIETAGVIEGELPVPTGNGVSEPLNRSASIVVVPLPTT